MLTLYDHRTPPGFEAYFRVCRCFFYGDRMEVDVKWVLREQRGSGPYPPEHVERELEETYQDWLYHHEGKRRSI